MAYLQWSLINFSEISNVWILVMNARTIVIITKKYKQNHVSLFSLNSKFRGHKFKIFILLCKNNLIETLISSIDKFNMDTVDC